MKNGLLRLSGSCCETITRATEGRAAILPGLPSFPQCFFRPLRSRLLDDRFRHLWSFVLAMAVNLRAAKLLRTHRCLITLGAQAIQANHQVNSPRMNRRLAARRAQIASDQLRRLVPAVKRETLRRTLCDHLLAA